MILAIDIGNTNVVLGLFNDDKLIESWRLNTASTRTIDECWVAVKLLSQDAGRDLQRIDGVVIGRDRKSVV